MDERESVSIQVEPLGRALLGGVQDEGEDGARRRVDVGMLPFFSDERPLQGLAAFIDWRSSGRLSGLVRDGMCGGQVGETLLYPGRTTLPVDRLVLVGLGSSLDFDHDRAQVAARSMVDIARGLSASGVLFAMPGGLHERGVSEAVLTALVEALRSGRPRVAAPEPRGSEEQDLDDEPGGADTDGDGEAADTDEDVAEPETGHGPEQSHRERWWIVAEPRHVSRMRRLLEGPPRPAGAA